MFEDIVKMAACGLCRIALDEKMTISYGNPYFYQLLSQYLPPEGLKDGTVCLKELLSWGEFEKIQKYIGDSVNNKQEEFEFETRLTCRGRGPLWLLITLGRDGGQGFATGTFIDITREKEGQEALRASEETNRIAVMHENIMTVRYHVPEKTLYCPKPIALQFDIPQICPDWPESARKDLIPHNSLGEFIRFHEKMILGVPYGHVKFQMQDKNKEIRWYSGDYTMLYDEEGGPLYGVISFKDHNEQWKKELAFEKWRQLYESWRGHSIGYYEVNLSMDCLEYMEGNISGCTYADKNMKFTDLVHLTAEHFIHPQCWKEYLASFNREGLLKRYFAGERSFQLEHRRFDEAGKPYWAMADLLIFKDPYSESIMCFITIKDINASKQSLMDLEERSKRDVLTGLFNRFTIMDKIHEVFKKTPGQVHGLVMLDIDNYKGLNDTLGHVFGDQVLKEISAALQNNVGREGIVGRLGGDEFIICLINIKSDKELSSRLESLCQSVHKIYPDGTCVTGSFGAAMYPKDGLSFEELYPKADQALYEAKHLGRNQFAIYHGKEE